MRFQTVIGLINFGFPDEVCFVNDRNTITLGYMGIGSQTVGAVLTLTNQQGETATLMYNSEQPNLTFNLFSTLKKMMHFDFYNVVTVTGAVMCGETSANITPFTLKCVDGRTLLSRQHNSERIIYYYDQSDLTGLQFLMREAGTINSYPVQSGIIKQNLSYHNGDFSVTIVEGGVTHVVHVKKSSLGGGADYDTDCLSDTDEGGINEISDGGLFRVRYYNTDGCQRFLIGKITSRKRTVGLTDWRADDLVRHTPNAMLTQTTDEITVGFPDIARESYAEDILYSPSVEYCNLNGEWMPCTISSKNIQLKEWDSNDIEITFRVLA